MTTLVQQVEVYVMLMLMIMVMLSAICVAQMMVVKVVAMPLIGCCGY